jgi:formamidopyrimidine-DNA glycosylase
MPELPEITSRAREMKKELVGRTITGVEVLQPKSLNVSKRAFAAALRGARVLDVTNRGKWIFVETSKGWLLLNLGMGGEIFLVTRATLPKKHRMIFDFDDGTCLTVNFWWVGLAHYVKPNELGRHSMTATLGPNALDLTPKDLGARLRGRRGAIKTFLLNQKNIAGIGNAYVHDILFMARLHPLKKIDTLTATDVKRLAGAIRKGLKPSLDRGGAFYEVNVHGKRGGFTMDDILIGYKAGKPCPVCGSKITKIKTGSTSSFICPKCQRLN